VRIIRPGVTGIVLGPQGLLLHRRSDNGRWGLPGGSVEFGETVAEAVVREVQEETGYDVEPVRLVGVYSRPDLDQIVTYADGNVIHYVSASFECRVLGGEARTCAESLEVAWFDPERPPPDLLPMHYVRIVDCLARQVGPFVR
jgi:ADP-ribose pyrophosphatase YjhB (NUDIX family)